MFAKEKKRQLSYQDNRCHDSNLPVTFCLQQLQNNFIGDRRVSKILGPTQNAWDPNLTRHVSSTTQIENS